MRPKKRELRELLYTEIVKSGTIYRLASEVKFRGGAGLETESYGTISITNPESF